MLSEAQKTVCRQAVQKWGRRHQLRKVVEELRELADELDLALIGESSLERIIDERADVTLVLYQLDELIMPRAVERVPAHLPVKIKKLQRYLEAEA